MKRLIAVLLVLIGTVSMSFACGRKCSNCGEFTERNCHNNPNLKHVVVNVSSCSKCPICSHCGGGHESYECPSFIKGRNMGINEEKNTCKREKNFKTRGACNEGYLQGVNDLNAAKKGEYTPEE